MKNILKGKLGTILILLATVVLAGVAVFTAIRLYDLRNQAVAPNVPSSMPKAAGLTSGEGGPCGESGTNTIHTCNAGLVCVHTGIGINGGTCQKDPNQNLCSVSFTLTNTPVVCNSKTAYKDVATNTPGSYNLALANKLAANAVVSTGQRIIYVVQPGPSSVTKSITITDTLPTNVTFVDSDNVCTYAAATRRVTCTLPNTNTQAAFRVSINTGATGVITNTATVQGAGDTASTCSVSVTVPVPQCNSTCTSTAQCSTGLTCYIPTGSTSGNCRVGTPASCLTKADCLCATATPTATPTSTPTSTPTTTPTPTGNITPTPTSTATGTPNSCNGTCGSNFNCADGMMCYQGFCRNPSCASSTTCSCGGSTSTPTATAPSLPQSGTDWPTVAGFGLGIFVIIGSLLLAL